MKRFEIVGGMASGKSTFARFLGQMLTEASVVTESFESVPFWSECLQSPGSFELLRDIAFLSHHAQLCVSERSISTSVYDFSFLEDQAYAKLSHNKEDLAYFQYMYTYTLSRMPPSQAIFLLSCPPELSLERVRSRGRPEEEGIDLDFIKRLQEELESGVDAYAAERGCKILPVSTAEHDFRSMEGGADLADWLLKSMQ